MKNCANCGLPIEKGNAVIEYDLPFCDNQCVRQWEKEHPEYTG
jgi:endogenous inhibitor of DNA gyrase (YacG/DUF329 family)